MVISTCQVPAASAGVEAMALGCTHYPHLKRQISSCLPGVAIVTQDGIIPDAAADYLARHSDLDARIGQNRARFFGVSDLNEGYAAQAKRMFGAGIALERVDWNCPGWEDSRLSHLCT